MAAWEAHGNNRRIAALDGAGVVPDMMAAGLVAEMTGEPVPVQPQGESSRHGPLPVHHSSAGVVLRHCSPVHRIPNPIAHVFVSCSFKDSAASVLTPMCTPRTPTDLPATQRP